MSAITAASDDEMHAEIERLRAENDRLKQQLSAAKSVPMKYKRMAFNAELQKENEELKQQLGQPIDMVLHCPACGMQHIDGPEAGKQIWGSNFESPVVEVGGWTNPPHRSHLCHGCGHIWRPADVATNGVLAVKTKGKDDSPVVQLAQQVPEGCVVVPVEPTDAMVQAAHHLDLSYMPGHEGADRAAIYRAMIHAAPAQQASAKDCAAAIRVLKDK